MWRPKTWAEVEALKGQAEETSRLDFKRDVTRNPETTKDIAAMTVDRGVLVYGVAEDEASRVVSERTRAEQRRSRRYG